MDANARIYVAGHKGLLGSALVRLCAEQGYRNVVTRTHAELDLCDTAATEAFFAEAQPEYVILAAARLGGIQANLDHPAEFIYSNLMIEASVIHAAKIHGVKRLIFFGSGCMYPRDCPQPMNEEMIMTGIMEKSSEAYAIAKLGGMKLCQAYNEQYGVEFLPLIPCTLYGPHDNFDPSSSHVVAALLRRFHETKINAGESGSGEPVIVWGTGTPRREFLYVDDMAQACLSLLAMPRSDLEAMMPLSKFVLNVGYGDDVSIADLAASVRDVVGFDVEIAFDAAKPDGAPRKLLDSSKIAALGWRPSIPLAEGLQRTYAWYKSGIHARDKVGTLAV